MNTEDSLPARASVAHHQPRLKRYHVAGNVRRGDDHRLAHQLRKSLPRSTAWLRSARQVISRLLQDLFKPFQVCIRQHKHGTPPLKCHTLGKLSARVRAPHRAYQ